MLKRMHLHKSMNDFIKRSKQYFKMQLMSYTGELIDLHAQMIMNESLTDRIMKKNKE